MKPIVYLVIIAITIGTGCSRKWKQPTHCTFNLDLKTDASSAINEINSSNFYINTLAVNGVREQASDINIAQTIDKQINSNTQELIEFDIPQGTYTELNAEILLSRNSGASHTLKINGKHYFSGGSFNQFRIDITSDILINAESFDADGTNTVILSKKVDRNANMVFDMNALLDEVPESYWIAASTGPGTIVIDSSSNQSLYLYVLMHISNYVDVRFL